MPPAPEGEIMDAVWDPETQDEFRYTRRYFAQLGRWHTDAGARRPLPHVAADHIDDAEQGVSFTLRLPEGERALSLPAEGLYSVYNALAAAAAATALGVPPDTICSALESHQAPPSDARKTCSSTSGESASCWARIHPASIKRMRTLQAPGERHHLLILLNDGIADGVDVSWIWDVDWESQAPHCRSLVVGGEPARPTWPCGWNTPDFRHLAPRSPRDTGEALSHALSGVPEHEQLVILPTYTAMLEVRQRFGQMGASRLWDVALMSANWRLIRRGALSRVAQPLRATEAMRELSNDAARLAASTPRFTPVVIGDHWSPDDADIILVGGGQDREQRRVQSDLHRRGAALRDYIEDDGVVLAVCGGFQLFGQHYRGWDGEIMEGIAAFDAVAAHPGPSIQRCVGNVVAIWEGETVVGFENHGGRTYLNDGQQAFASVVSGFGNNGGDGLEGARRKNAFGTYLHGAVLPKNPRLADRLIALALQRRYGSDAPALGPLDDRAALRAHAEALHAAFSPAESAIGRRFA